MQLLHLGLLKISRQRIYVNYLFNNARDDFVVAIFNLILRAAKTYLSNVYRAVIPRRGLSTWAEGIDSRVGPAGPTTDE